MKPFVSEGFVSLKSSSSQVPTKILSDTGVTQPLLLEGVLPLSVSTSTAEIIAQCIEKVSLLLGNGLAGGKVVADPKVTCNRITLLSTEKLDEVIPDILPLVL